MLSNKFKAHYTYYFKQVFRIILDAKKSLPLGWYCTCNRSKAFTPAVSNNCSYRIAFHLPEILLPLQRGAGLISALSSIDLTLQSVV